MSNSERQDAEALRLAGLNLQIRNLQTRISEMDVSLSMNTNMNIGNFMEEILGIQAEIVSLLGKLGRE